MAKLVAEIKIYLQLLNVKLIPTFFQKKER